MLAEQQERSARLSADDNERCGARARRGRGVSIGSSDGDTDEDSEHRKSRFDKYRCDSVWVWEEEEEEEERNLPLEYTHSERSRIPWDPLASIHTFVFAYVCMYCTNVLSCTRLHWIVLQIRYYKNTE